MYIYIYIYMYIVFTFLLLSIIIQINQIKLNSLLNSWSVSVYIIPARITGTFFSKRFS